MEKNEFSLKMGEKMLSVKIDNLAEQANGSVFVRLGDTMVLATATMSHSDLKDLDFFPLTVEFEEKYYAVGKILGSRFVRREGRPSDESILTGRLIDRALRPLFPKDLKREVQIIVDCYSFDEENDPDVPALLAASLAIGISDIPFNGPVAPVSIVKKGENFLISPSYKEKEGSSLEIFLSGVEGEKGVLINMIEGQGNETKESDILESVDLAQQEIEKIIKFQNEIIKECGKEKVQIVQNNDLLEIKNIAHDSLKKRLEDAMFTSGETKNKKTLEDIKEELAESVKTNLGEEKLSSLEEFISQELKQLIARNVLQKELRPDGRKLNEIRPIDSQINILPRTHGSGIFIRGKTKALSIVTLGSPADQRLIEGMEFRGKKRFMHHYNFPPYCSGEIKPIRGPSRREIGHGMLAEKAILPLIPNFEDFPYTIRVVTEILSSNGSTSMAAVSSSSLALMDAGVPLKKPAAGIAIGIIESGEEYRLLSDIQGPEDHLGGMDFKVAGTKDGITAIQLDVKILGLNEKMIKETLDLAKKARAEILEKTGKTISRPKENLSPLAPQIERIKIEPEKIGGVIGAGGRVINAIIEQCSVEIDIEDDGSIFISSNSRDSIKKAKDWIEGITKEIKIGEIFEGKVKKILDFGAIVEILPEREGMVHISELAPYRVNKVEDVVRVGETIPVKVLALDDSGKIRLSLKEARQRSSNHSGKIFRKREA